MPTACPSLEVLAAYLEHALTREEQDALQRHLIACRTCREMLKESLSDFERSRGESAK